MAKWKLSRQMFGVEEFTFADGDKVTIGRAICNNVCLPSAIVSRKHCIIEVQTNNAIITDLQSANGVFVGDFKVPPNKPYVIGDSDLIGIGWSEGAPLVKVDDSDKYVFKFNKEKSELSLPSRIRYQDDDEVVELDADIAKGNEKSKPDPATREQSAESSISTVLSLKRKINPTVSKKAKVDLLRENDDIIDSRDPIAHPLETSAKKLKIELANGKSQENELLNEDAHADPLEIGAINLETASTNEKAQKNGLLNENGVKNENELVEYDAFSVKQELLGYDDELINVDSESDGETEQWVMRLSQNSPGKPFTKVTKIQIEIKPEDCSYSQLDDDFLSNSLIYESEEDFEDDIIQIPEQVGVDVVDTFKVSDNAPYENASVGVRKETTPEKNIIETSNDENIEEASHDENMKGPSHVVNIIIDEPITSITPLNNEQSIRQHPEQFTKSHHNDLNRKAQMIEPLVHLPKGKLNRLTMETKPHSISSKYTDKIKTIHSIKETRKSDEHKKIVIAHKEERKKKLKEIATKDKEIEITSKKDSTSSVRPVTNVKITSSNRGAFLSEETQAIVKRKDKINNNKDKKADSSKDKETKGKKVTESSLENRPKDCNKPNTTYNCKDPSENISTKKVPEKDTTMALKNLKPISKVISNQPVNSKKKVSFSNEPPNVRVFVIEPGNRMKKTSSVKTTLVDVRQNPVFSLEKLTLMKILRWNPQWLEEQLNNDQAPPILGHKNAPMTVFHRFKNHSQYVQFVGDLLLMEIWACLSIAHTKTHNQNYIRMTIESPVPVQIQERYFDLLSLNVNVSLHPSEIRNLPRFGEIMHVNFESENIKTQRFFYVHNVKQLPSAPGQSKYFYNISLYASMTEKIMSLQPGTIILGKSLAYINKELTLFEAMEYLAGSPLRDAILQPSPDHFRSHLNQAIDFTSPWIKTLNPSQLKAVNLSVAAALSDKPSIQMVQGPPGTGKSSVICAIVMSYFYDAQSKKQQNRGKILICATSNAAVDGLVIRLLNLRQNLPKLQRFRMVRVGREEAMHPTAANVSSQQLAQRDIARSNDQPPSVAGLHEEILHLEAKVNMWNAAAMDATDPQRIAYCQGRANDVVKRINLLKSGGGSSSGGRRSNDEEMRIAAAERWIIEHADIVVTTLASAHNNKMKGLKRRIALCIIDEAGQVIEPETLIPLTLDVTRLTLIGDPQQLPGFICSQQAKTYGLGESLLSRLISCTNKCSDSNPMVLLDQQYRMHPDIADYPSRAFYGGMVQTEQPVRPDNIRLPPYCILAISSGDRGQGISGANEMEAWGVTRLAMALDSLLRPLKLNLAVITPYAAHKELIKKHLKTLNNQVESQVEVNTVDSFQGQERDVVLVSLARSRGVGFLTDTGRMNVMLTRAKHALLICLNPHAVMNNDQWRTLIDDAQIRRVFTKLPNNMCQPLTAEQVAKDDILKYIINKK